MITKISLPGIVILENNLTLFVQGGWWVVDVVVFFQQSLCLLQKPLLPKIHISSPLLQKLESAGLTVHLYVLERREMWSGVQGVGPSHCLLHYAWLVKGGSEVWTWWRPLLEGGTTLHPTPPRSLGQNFCLFPCCLYFSNGVLFPCVPSQGMEGKSCFYHSFRWNGEETAVRTGQAAKLSWSSPHSCMQQGKVDQWVLSVRQWWLAGASMSSTGMSQTGGQWRRTAACMPCLNGFPERDTGCWTTYF